MQSLMIHYAHVIDGVFYNGTFMSRAGEAAGSWTIDRDDDTEPKSVERDITVAEFGELWALLKDPAIAVHTVRDPEAMIEPMNFHLINASFEVDDKQGSVLAAIPNDAAVDAKFEKWLKLLNVPVGQ